MRLTRGPLSFHIETKTFYQVPNPHCYSKEDAPLALKGHRNPLDLNFNPIPSILVIACPSVTPVLVDRPNL